MNGRVAFAQDHLVQRGGAERVLLAMLRAVPGAELVTPFYEPSACYAELEAVPIRTSGLNRVPVVRAHHRAAFPVLPLVVRRLRVDADVVVCGTSGWAQGVPTDGRKVLYFHGLARWLHDQAAYLKGAGRTRRLAANGLAPALRSWDRRTVASGHRFLAGSTDMCRRLREIHGVEAELLRLPNSLAVSGPREETPGLDDGFFLCVSRLMPYKNVDVVVEAFAGLPRERLVVAGDGPLLGQLAATAPPNITFLGRCGDDQLRWLYERCRATVTSAIEPFGLTPVEAAAFGRPTVALRAGGFLDTVLDGVTGLHFDRPHPADVRVAVARLRSLDLDEATIVAHAAKWDEATFAEELRTVIDEELAHAR